MVILRNLHPHAAASGRDVLGHRERRAEEHAFGDHHVEQVVVDRDAVLDRVDAGEERVLDSRTSHRVRGDLVPQPVRFIDDGFHLLERECRSARQRAVLLHEVRAIGVDLDPVGAVRELLANRFASALDAIHNLHAHRKRHFRRISARAVAAGHRHRSRRHKQSRTGNHAVGNRALHIDIRVHRALGLEVAQRGESVIEGDPDRAARAERAVRHRLAEELFIVIGRGDVALQKNVRVRVDQPRQQRHVTEVDGLRVGGRGAADRLDAVSAHDDRRRGNDGAATAVDEARRANDNRVVSAESRCRE